MHRAAWKYREQKDDNSTVPVVRTSLYVIFCYYSYYLITQGASFRLFYVYMLYLYFIRRKKPN